jgi:hypothetical protein
LLFTEEVSTNQDPDASTSAGAAGGGGNGGGGGSSASKVAAASIATVISLLSTLCRGSSIITQVLNLINS